MKTVLTLTAIAAITLFASQAIAAPDVHTDRKTATYKTDSCKKAHNIHRDRMKEMAAKHCEIKHRSVLDQFRYYPQGCDFITRGKPPTLVIGGVKFTCK